MAEREGYQMLSEINSRIRHNGQFTTILFVVLIAGLSSLSAIADDQREKYSIEPFPDWLRVSREEDFVRLGIDTTSAVMVDVEERGIMETLLLECRRLRVQAVFIFAPVSGFNATDLKLLGAANSALKRLHISGLRKPDGFMNLDVSDFSNLEEISLSHQTIDDSTAEWLSRLPKLRSADVGGTDITDKGLAKLGRSKTLKRLGLFALPITGEGFSSWSEDSELEYLDVNHTSLSRKGALSLRRFTKLRSLSFRQTVDAETTRLVLDPLTQLRHVTVGRRGFGGALFDDSVVSCLVRLPHLEYLDVSNTYITTKGVEVLAKVKTLKALVLSGTPIDVHAFDFIGEMKQLELLYVQGTCEQALNMAQLGKLTRLRSLDLSGCNLTDESLGELTTLENLEWLNVVDTPLTVKCVPTLAKIPRLKEIRIGSRHFTDNALEELRKTLPRCKVSSTSP